jgi:tRNA 5-methylaminomethyl-2-thiouridine biosynthesis bifunctional protein
MAETADIDWTPEGTPRSRRFDDIYFSREGGLEESRAVFLQGCGLPDAWAGRRRFVVGELGFGTGLNILALLQLWAQARPADGRLQVFSIEAFPLSPRDAARALHAWPELAPLAKVLLDRWPQARGLHRIDIPGLNATLDLAVAEAAEALQAWRGRADAWFLDGFSPARNPEMWREEVLALVADRSAPGARLATFTVAGAVRRGLEAQGFAVDKRPGFGAKGERLEARLPGSAPEAARPPRVCVLGAGIAGASLARALTAEGLKATVVDRAGPGAGASGNPAALVTPRFDAGGGAAARLHAQAFRRARALIPGAAVIARGALQLERTERDRGRFDVLAGSDLFSPGELERLTPEAAGERLGEPSSVGGLWLHEALVVEPRLLLEAWLGEGDRMKADVARIERAGGAWRLFTRDGELVCEAEALCLASGHESIDLFAGLRLQPVRGQASYTAWPEPVSAAAWGGYVVPTRQGLLFGATHDRGQATGELRPEDHGRNLELLARARPRLAAALGGRALQGRAAVRAATPDHLPLAGAVPENEGLFVLGGLGGRGFVLAPLLAEHVAASLASAPSPLPGPLADATAPGRFDGR